MIRTAILVLAASTVLTGCIATDAVTGRADNDMLRFSAMNYTLASERAR